MAHSARGRSLWISTLGTMTHGTGAAVTSTILATRSCAISTCPAVRTARSSGIATRNTACVATTTAIPIATSMRFARAFEHDLPYFDDQVHFPDLRIEYEDRDGCHRHEDIEAVCWVASRQTRNSCTQAADVVLQPCGR